MLVQGCKSELAVWGPGQHGVLRPVLQRARCLTRGLEAGQHHVARLYQHARLCASMHAPCRCSTAEAAVHLVLRHAGRHLMQAWHDVTLHCWSTLEEGQ